MKLRAAPSLLLLSIAASAFTLSACTSGGYRVTVHPAAPFSSYAAVGIAESAGVVDTDNGPICIELQDVAQAAGKDGGRLSAAAKRALRLAYTLAQRDPPFAADPELAADLPPSAQTMNELMSAVADCVRLGYSFATPAPTPAVQTQHVKPAAALVWALLLGTVVVPLLIGVGLWTARSGIARSKADPERDAYVGRMSVFVARLAAIALATWLSGPKLADITGWRRPTTVGTVAVVATVLVGIYTLVIHRRLVAAGRPSASGRYAYLLGVMAVSVVPWLIVGLGGAILTGSDSRIGAVIVAAVLSVALWWYAAPWLTVAFLTKPCPPDVHAVVLELCKRHGQSIRAVRLIPTRGRPLAWAAVFGASSRTRYIVVSEDLVQNLSPPLFAAIIAHEIGHLAVNKHPWRSMALATVAIAYVYAYFAFVSGNWPLVAAIVIAFQPAFSATKQRREFAADAFAASSSGPAVIEAALTRIAEINGIRLDAGAVTYVGATHPHLAARINAIRAAATPPSNSPPPSPESLTPEPQG